MRTRERRGRMVGIGALAILLASAASPPPGRDPGAEMVDVDLTSRWCGAKALWLLARARGRPCTLEEIKRLCDPDGRSGGILSLKTLTDVSSQIGLSGLAVKCRPDWLFRDGLPAIVPQRAPGKGVGGGDFLHFLIAIDTTEDGVRIIDPFFPNEVQLYSRERFLANWTGDALIVAPSAAQLGGPSNLLVALGVADLCLIGIALLALGLRGRGARVGVTAAVLPLVLGTMAGCGTSGGRTLMGRGGLEFDHVRHDAGTLVAGENRLVVEHSFPFTNRSSVPVTIQAAEAGCSCTSVLYPKGPIPPGGKGAVEVTVDLDGRAGSFVTSLQVVTGGEKPVRQRLTHSSFVVAAARLSSETVSFGEVPVGAGAVREVTVRVPLAPDESPPAIEDLKHHDLGISYDPGPAEVYQLQSVSNQSPLPEAAFAIGIRLAPRDRCQEVEDRLTFRLAGRPRPISIRVEGEVVHPDVVAIPRSINFGPIGTEASRRKVLLKTRDGRPFPGFSLAAPAASSRLKVWSRPDPKDASSVEVWAEMPPTPGGSGFHEDSVTIRFDAAGVPSLPIPYLSY